MKFEVVNENLKIASCGLADLTMDQVQNFLSRWEEGANIGSLTLFYDSESGYVVLNRDNKNYEAYLETAEAYIGASERVRREARDKAPESLKETLLVLENTLRYRDIKQAIFMARHNCIDDKDTPILNTICKETENIVGAVCLAFRYGVMCGKRKERARRKVVVA